MWLLHTAGPWRGPTATSWAPTDPGVPLLLSSSGVPGEEEGGPGWLALGPPSSCRWEALKHARLGPGSSGDSGTQPWVTAHELGSVLSSTRKPDL